MTSYIPQGRKLRVPSKPQKLPANIARFSKPSLRKLRASATRVRKNAIYRKVTRGWASLRRTQRVLGALVRLIDRELERRDA